LRDALKNACKGEAHADLQNQIAYLRAQLDASKSTAGPNSISDSKNFEAESLNRTIATLQLRVGELEEMDGTHRTEIANLYQSLSEQTSKSTRLESLCAEQKEELEKGKDELKDETKRTDLLQKDLDASLEQIDVFKKRISDLDVELQVEKDKSALLEKQKTGERQDAEESLNAEIGRLHNELSEQTATATKLDTLCSQQRDLLGKMKAASDKMKKKKESLRNERDTVKAEVKRCNKLLKEAKVEAQVEKDKSKILETQAEAREKDSQLQSEQAKSRFQVQDERIHDLEQQLSSLYVAFEMLRQEHSHETKRRSAMQENLFAADLQVAKFEEEQEKKKMQQPPMVQQTPTKVMQLPQSPPVSTPNTVLMSPESTKSLPPVAASPKSHFSPSGTQKMISGYLWKFDKNLLKGWKKRFFILFGSEGAYHMSYSDGPKQYVKGTITMRTGISTVTQTREFPKTPYAFVIHVNRHEAQAPVVTVAANDDKDLARWLSALRIVTEGQDVYNNGSRQEVQEESDRALALRLQRQMM